MFYPPLKISMHLKLDSLLPTQKSTEYNNSLLACIINVSLTAVTQDRNYVITPFSPYFLKKLKIVKREMKRLTIIFRQIYFMYICLKRVKFLSLTFSSHHEWSVTYCGTMIYPYTKAYVEIETQKNVPSKPPYWDTEH